MLAIVLDKEYNLIEVIHQVSYLSAQQAAIQWGISKRRVQTLCSNQRIPDAVRIGNMWIIPQGTIKPTDARKKVTVQNGCIDGSPIKAARKALRIISTQSYRVALKEINDTSCAKKTVMALLTCEFLENTISSFVKDGDDINERISSWIHELLGVEPLLTMSTSSFIRKQFRGFLNEHEFCVDDALSWTYQYINKLSLDTGLESTQFFTEKYMISSLIDKSKITDDTEKILDPACGGGNFLIYALDYLCDNSHKSNATSTIHEQLMRLYGYELDPVLATIASINLRLKFITILQAHGHNVIAEDFFTYIPHIYHSLFDNIEGSLDADAENHKVIQVGTNRILSLSDVLSSAKYIFTNPPFQTVKRMAADKKEFLKKHYPDVKCDLCNAFIKFSLGSLIEGGACGLVTQNSWMYLDSFEQMRKSLLKDYSITSIVELGSNAFYDLTGEKSNVALISAKNVRPNSETFISTYSLKHLAQTEMESILSYGRAIDDFLIKINQLDVIMTLGSSLSILNTSWSNSLLNNFTHYADYATPMQGTSTGDSKSFVGYFWEHIGDNDWLPVSKGGGFSRWLGLNSYSVKWGKDGEYIQNVPGSAIRNAKYFNETKLVFSDTGTAGLNVRLLQKGQIFIASGPGIRIKSGNEYSHLAFLNSRFSSYFIRLLSPKLTIAAGYISKIPACEELFNSKEIVDLAKACVNLKKDRLSKCPTNMEFKTLDYAVQSTTLNEQAYGWFLNDIKSEWLQLCNEKEIDSIIMNSFNLSTSARKSIDDLVGIHACDINSSTTLSFEQLDNSFNEVLSVNCTLKRTRASKTHLGCDGVLEFLAHKNTISPRHVFDSVINNVGRFHKTILKYRSAYIHALLLSTLGYSASSLPVCLPIDLTSVVENVSRMYPNLINELSTVENWIINDLNEFHRASFYNTPIIRFSAEHNAIVAIR